MAYQLVQMAQQFRVGTNPVAIFLDDLGPVAILADDERIAPFRTSPDVDRVGGDDVTVFVQNPHAILFVSNCEFYV
jgi:hypothetical protein